MRVSTIVRFSDVPRRLENAPANSMRILAQQQQVEAPQPAMDSEKTPATVAPLLPSSAFRGGMSCSRASSFVSL
jgi:hypothetical protein